MVLGIQTRINLGLPMTGDGCMAAMDAVLGRTPKSMDAAHQTPIQQGTFPAFHAMPCCLSSFACVVADPPWDVMKGAPQGRPQGVQMASEKLDYPTMSVKEIAALEIPAADDAHLYIWTINKYIRETYDIARAWGFEPSTMLYWLKTPKGIGLGGAFAQCVEPVLFCRRGKLPTKRRMDRNWWNWPRGKHSAKPEEFQSIVEQISPGPYLEMFARRKREGWASWGNEITPDVAIQSPDNA